MNTDMPQLEELEGKTLKQVPIFYAPWGTFNIAFVTTDGGETMIWAGEATCEDVGWMYIDIDKTKGDFSKLYGSPLTSVKKIDMERGDGFHKFRYEFKTKTNQAAIYFTVKLRDK